MMELFNIYMDILVYIIKLFWFIQTIWSINLNFVLPQSIVIPSGLSLITFWGVNFSIWGLIGLIRYTTEKKFGSKLETNIRLNISPKETAAIIPAHNEELVIQMSIRSLLCLLPKTNIYIVSDGSVDQTVQLAKECGVNVLALKTAHGKARALEYGLRHFKLTSKYKAVLFVDADTVLAHDYLQKALPFFNNKEVVAVGGWANTMWRPQVVGVLQLYFISHRERVYYLVQRLLKFGQSWRFSNVTFIIPGFASIYRSTVLDKININPGGLVIEDFNMTFEIQNKNLGKIVHTPLVNGYTQDPDNLWDYYKQVRRWDLGFWQTIKLHKMKPNLFWLAMIVLLIEVIFASILVVVVPFLILTILWMHLMPNLTPVWLLSLAWLINLTNLIIIFWLPDYLISIIIGLIRRRPQYFFYGVFFIFLRYIDAFLFLITLPQAFLVNSNGRWASPVRRGR